MRISFHAEEVEHHPLRRRQLPYQPHDLGPRNLRHIFLLRFGNLLLRRIDADSHQPLRLPHVIDHHVDRNPRAPRLQGTGRPVFPMVSKILIMPSCIRSRASSLSPTYLKQSALRYAAYLVYSSFLASSSLRAHNLASSMSSMFDKFANWFY